MQRKSSIDLIRVRRSDVSMLTHMVSHYSQPKGFVGRNLCYAIMVNNFDCYGCIVGGSATRYLPGRNEYFDAYYSNYGLDNIINNNFFHVERKEGKYPARNFVGKVLRMFRDKIVEDWEHEYNDKVMGFESLVEPPRTGECYLRDGWQYVGRTKGLSCKRVGGTETGKYTGKRVWNYVDLRPKLVFVKVI